MGRLLLSFILSALAGVLSLSAATGLHAKSIPGDQIKIGAIVDLTGPHASQGQLNLKGMEDFFRYINDTAAGVSGRRLSLAIVDGAADLPNVLEDVKKSFIAEKVKMSAVLKPDIHEEIETLLSKNHIPHVDVSGCRTALLPLGSYTYRPFGGAGLSFHAIIQYIAASHRGPNPPRVGILIPDNSCGESINRLSPTPASGDQIRIVATLRFQPGAPNLETPLLKLKDAGAEYVFMQCNAPDALTALNSAERIHFSAPFFSPWTAINGSMRKRSKGLFNRPMNISFPGCLPGDDTPGIHLIKVLLDRYQSASGFRTAYWEGVAVAAIVARALHRAHEILGKIDVQTVNLALETFQKEDFGGLIPDVTYTDTKHNGSFVTRIVRFNRDHTLTPLTKFWNPKTEKVDFAP